MSKHIHVMATMLDDLDEWEVGEVYRELDNVFEHFGPVLDLDVTIVDAHDCNE